MDIAVHQVEFGKGVESVDDQPDQVDLQFGQGWYQKKIGMWSVRSVNYMTS